jgi:nitrite reductase/ring-hydroxylating ferredoxin subunit
MHWTALENSTKEKLDQLQLFQTAKLVWNEKTLCVTRLEEGFFAVSNSCPHAGAQLHHGSCNRRGIITCPLHGYKFDVKSGNSADGNNYKLSNYRFKTEDGILYIGSK